MKYRYDELTWPEIRAAVKQDPVVVLPVGTTEQHGYHLPLMVDSLCAEAIARAAVEQTAPNAILMPTVAYGFNEHHLDYPGTIAIDAHTMIDYIVCIGRSLAHHGFRHILLLNGHGSNVPFLDIAARLITNQTAAICAMTSWWSMLTDEDLTWRESRFPGGMAHACEIETSLLLRLREDLVDLSKAVDEVDGVQTSENIYWDLNAGGAVNFQEFFSRNTLSGVQGQPTLATAEKGAKTFEAAVSHLARFLDEFRAREIRPRRDLHDAEKYPTP
ncbi:MAG TPA: creatininase family protein [Chloroflexota bacterium]|nr:creatininase family protein [Chloroflexota bacterium]